MRTVGFPLPVFLEGGFATIKLFRWSSLVVDLLVLFGSAAAMSWAWKKVFVRKLRSIAP
jgi:hypothetical protein